MSIELYQRGKIWWFKGRIEQLPGSKYYRQSSNKASKVGAQAVVNNFINKEMKKFYGDDKIKLTFAEAVQKYDATPEMARDLLMILDDLGDLYVEAITAEMVRDLGRKLYPMGSTDYWCRHVITPVRAVINKAHDLGLCPPIRIAAYKPDARLRQDRRRGKKSRVEKEPGNWQWLTQFRGAASERLGALALFMFMTAARIGQATSIKFTDLDVDGCRILMPASKQSDSEWVDIDPDLCRELASLKPRLTRRGGRKQASDRLFGYQRGDGVRGTWKRVCRKAGIPIILPHAAGRHGFATELLIRQRLDAVTVAKAGRWADVSMLVERYAHPENLKEQIHAAFRTGRVQLRDNISAKP